MSAGVLNKRQIRQELLESSPPKIKSHQSIEIMPDPSAIDIPLGDKYFCMPASCRPNERLVISDLIQKHGGKCKELRAGSVLKRNHVYCIPTGWSLELDHGLVVRSTAKSSIGRVDVLVRLLADHQREFDTVESNGKSIPLYVEVIPIAFDIKVSPGMCLSQIRFVKGSEFLCTVPRDALAYEDPPVLVVSGGKRADLKGAKADENAVLLSLDLTPDQRLGFVGFAAKTFEKDRDREPIDPSVRKNRATGEDPRYDPREFWDPVTVDSSNGTLQISRDRFYIFRSRERLRIPPHLAVDSQAYSESLGDIRIHYAGFAHPYFGFERDEGTPLIFEVRGHNIDTILRDGDALAKVYFRRMSRPAERPKDENREYDNQELQLSKCFKEW